MVERLESRAMLAIFAHQLTNGDTVVAIDGNSGLTDLDIRGAGAGGQIAANPEFVGVWTSDPADWINGDAPNPNAYDVGNGKIYITNATPNEREIPVTEASGFAQGDTAMTTNFSLSNGDIVEESFTGTLAYGGNTWSMTSDADGRLKFALVGGPGTGPLPRNGFSILRKGENRGDRGDGLRGSVFIRWTAAVETYVDDCPRIVSAGYRYGGDTTGEVWSEEDVGVSFEQGGFRLPDLTPKNGFGGSTLLTAGGGINVVGGTRVIEGTITVYDVARSGNSQVYEDLTFTFSDASGKLVFTPNPRQNNRWIDIDPESTLDELRFVSRSNAGGGTGGGTSGGTGVVANEEAILPGRVTLQAHERWLEHTAEAAPTDVTIWAGLDVANDITVEMTRSGGSFNVLSPIVKAPSLTVLGSSTVNLEAPISVTGGVSLGQGQVEGSSRPNVNTAVFDAASAAATYSFLVVDGSLTVSPTGSMAGALPTATGQLVTPAGGVSGRMVDADFFVQGTIYATTQFYDLNNLGYTRPNAFTTRSASTGLDSGLVRGGTVVVNMAAQGESIAPPDATNADVSYHDVDLRTEVTTFRTRAASAGLVYPGVAAYPYNLSVREKDSITFDAVAGSSRPISLSAEGAITMSSALATLSDVTIAAVTPAGAAPNPFTVSAPIVSRFGSIDISAAAVTVGNDVRVTHASVDEGKIDIRIEAYAGDLVSRNLVAAVNDVSLLQRANGANLGRLDAAGVRARALAVEAAGDVTLGTTVETLSGASGGGFSVRESDDISITSLQAGGRVALSAAGVDGDGATANPIALTARIDDVTALEVSTPNGSADVLVNTPRSLVLGGSASPTIANMQAAGNVRIRSTAGDIRVNDAPVAGGNARVVKAASTFVLPATYDAGTPAVKAGTLKGTGSINALNGGKGLFDSQSLQIGDRVLVRLGSRSGGVTTTNSNGVYVVARVGGGVGINADWQLTRAADADTAAELDNGAYVKVSVGPRYAGSIHQVSHPKFPVAVASLSATDTIEIPASYPALAGLTVGQRVTGAGIAAGAVITAIDAVTGEITLTPGSVSPGVRSLVTFVAPDLGRAAVGVTPVTLSTDIGSDAIAKTLTFVVTTSGGTNSSAGSLGKMLTLRQQNDTSNSANPEQITKFAVGQLSAPIRLAQELPEIRQAFDIAGTGVVIDGSRITTARNGQPLAAGAEVNGFVFATGSGAGVDPDGNPQAGASLSGFTIGGFAQGAAVKIDNASGIRVSNVVLGRGATGLRLANRHGVLATGAGVTSGTVLDSSIYASTVAGFAVENGASGMQFVGSTVGGANLNNAVGVRLASTTGGNRIGLEPAGPTSVVPQAVVALAQGSATFTLPATYAATAVLPGLGVRGTGIPAGTVVAAVNAATRVVTLSGPATASGSATLSFGNFVTTAVGSKTLVLPAGVPMENLYLGQRVSGTGIPATARIVAIDAASRRVTLSAEMTAAGTTAVTFGVGGRNEITANLTGMVLAAGSNTVINTNVTSNTFDGIVIEGGSQRIGTAKKTSATSNAIHSNGGFGVRQAATAVAAQQRIWGNYINMAVNGRTQLANGRGGISPVRVVDPVTQLDADGNQYGPVGGAGGGSGSPVVRPRT